VPNADNCRATPEGHAREPGHGDRLPVEVRQQLLDAIYAGEPFRTALRDLGLTSNQVFGLAKTDEEWAATLETALTATRRDDLQHGTTPAYVRGCVCSECREHQRVRMGVLNANVETRARNFHERRS
jgi:hypothetical protein